MSSLCIFSGCQEMMPIGSYDSQQTFRDSLNFGVFSEFAHYEGPARRPVIIVHGLLGAKLRDKRTDKIVWGEFSRSGFDDEFFRTISHPMKYGSRLSAITDGVVPAGVMLFAEIKFFGMTFEQAGYAGLIDILKSAGYALEGHEAEAGKHYPTLFLFAYDWRRDPVENAARLDAFIRIKRAQLRGYYARNFNLRDYDVKFDLIAHSMGGLVTRYYLMYGGKDLPEDGSIPDPDWAGARFVDRVAIVGTPNSGYLDTVLEMSDGLKLNPAAPPIPPAVVATMPSYYAMLPGSPVGGEVRNYLGAPLDLYDPAVWESMHWGLADPDEMPTLRILLPNAADDAERREIALEHMRKCLKRAKQLAQALAVDETPPDAITLGLFAGDAVPTSKVAEADRSGNLKVTAYDAGDGKVLGSSARYDRFYGDGWRRQYDSPIKWDSMTYIPAAHMGITKSTNFASNLLGFLLLTPPEQRQEFQALPPGK